MEFISRVLLEVNGQNIDDFKSFTENEVELYKPVNLMYKTGYMAVQPRHVVQVEYVVPKTNPEFDWRSVKDGRLTIDKENDKRVTFTGVYVQKVGEVKYDGENEATQTIELGATKRVEE